MEHLPAKYVVAALAALLPIGACTPSAGDIASGVETHSVTSSSPDFMFSSKIGCSGSQVVFSSSLKNQSREELVITSASLPWDTATLANSWEVKALPSKRNIPRQFFGSDHAPGPVFLSPDESLSGNLNLTELFPALNEALQSGDVEITHSYWLQLPKRSEVGDVYERVVVKRGWCRERKRNAEE